LGFVCELDTGRLESLFSNPDVVSELKQLNAEVSLSMSDLSGERAGIVRRLNDAGIPVTAWMALPSKNGAARTACGSRVWASMSNRTSETSTLRRPAGGDNSRGPCSEDASMAAR
jgi:hypothetical protein